MADPTITVILCTRDRSEMMKRCLKSLLVQDYGPYEIILVENASKHFMIPPVLSSRPVRIFSYPIPGLSAARNLAVRQARGEVLAFLDDDAVAQPDWLRQGQKNFRDGSVGCVTGKILPLFLETEWQRRLASAGWFPSDSNRREFDQKHFDPLQTSPGTGSNLFIRKQFFDQNCFPELFGPGTPVFAADEHYLFHDMIRADWKIVYDPDAVVHHDYASDRQSYENVIRKYSISRGAYLTKFLFTEKGFRMQAWEYLFRKTFGRESGAENPMLAARITGLLKGPFALIASALRKKTKAELVLLAEYPGEFAI